MISRGRRIEPAELLSQDPAARGTMVQNLKAMLPNINARQRRNKRFFSELVSRTGVC